MLPKHPDERPEAVPANQSDLLQRSVRAFGLLRTRAPRVQCLTNTVAQQITANTLLALGARVSMASHPAEVVAMSETADALLINLGTPDAARLDAVAALSRSQRVQSKPVLLDPVFVEHSALRTDAARTVLGWKKVVVKANATEASYLFPRHAPFPEGVAAMIVTGAVDQIHVGSVTDHPHVAISNGDPLMTKVTGLGCALGAVMAAVWAVEDDPIIAAMASLLTLEIAAELAARKSSGPGTFAATLLDTLTTIEADIILRHAKIHV